MLRMKAAHPSEM